MCSLPRHDNMLFKLGLQTYGWKAMWGVACSRQRSLQDPNQKFNLKDLSKDLALFLRILEDLNKGLCKDFNENWRIFIFTDLGNIVVHAEFHFCCLIKIPYWITNLFKNHTAFERESLEFIPIKEPLTNCKKLILLQSTLPLKPHIVIEDLLVVTTFSKCQRF